MMPNASSQPSMPFSLKSPAFNQLKELAKTPPNLLVIYSQLEALY